jgi:predicted lipoprotein with Yx(FWY)xxD motif
MKSMLAAVAVAAAVLAPAALADASPVVAFKAAKFGTIAATRGHLALYTWDLEKDKKVHCTGSCAKVWPPLTVARGATLARHAAGIMGTLGQITRPDGSHQVTLNGRPLYTYHRDTPTRILCDGVDGWYVVRA